jgi:tRNA pseudouridine32 synthase/23S rRNA pseudouridine746 synthase/23S rRNA pseudouridine1911/1915/1917 synthase
MTGEHKRPGSATKFLPRGLAILHEDRDILVVDKPAGLLTIATTRDKTRTAYFMLTDYVRKGNARSRERLFIVHRLDRETSGVLVFAKHAEAKLRLQDHWKETEKKYLAVVHGRVARSAQTITTYLAENTAHVVYSTPNAAEGKLSQTAYTVVRQAKDLALLEVAPLTGRKHQIRVHLAGIGHPVVGDPKYGKANDSYPRLALHARSLTLNHPATGRRLTFEARVPAFFDRLVGV